MKLDSPTMRKGGRVLNGDTDLVWKLAQLAAVASVLLLIGCSQKQHKSENRFIDDVFVRGVCSEDHTTVSSNYEGDITDWYKLATQTHFRSGIVFNLDSQDVDKMLQHFSNPSQYVPPFEIAFSNLSENDIAGGEFTLHGVSDRDDDGGGGFNATCRLKVTKRFDHRPTAQERAAMRR
jgi:hypothetical protein